MAWLGATASPQQQADLGGIVQPPSPFPAPGEPDLGNKQHTASGPGVLLVGVTQHAWILSAGRLPLLCKAMTARKVSGEDSGEWAPGAISAAGRRLIRAV